MDRFRRTVPAESGAAGRLSSQAVGRPVFRDDFVLIAAYDEGWLRLIVESDGWVMKIILADLIQQSHSNEAGMSRGGSNFQLTQKWYHDEV